MTANRSTATAQGKINLHLAVGDVRPDGYHELTTVFQAVDLTERVTIEYVGDANSSGIRSLTVSGFDAHLVPTDSSNLAWRAVEAIQELDGAHTGGQSVSIHIDKGVPVAGGMAGGSADAAAALLAASDLFFRDSPADAPDMNTLMAIAAELGADVPFCLHGGTALGTGKGENLVPVMTSGTYHWAIATDKRGLSTPSVFAQLDKQREAAAAGQRPNRRTGTPDALMLALRSGDPHQLAEHLSNDLQAPAISLLPSLRQTLQAAREAGALTAIVSGSGPTVAMLCTDHDHAVDVATAVSVSGTASATLTTSTPGPAAGVEK